MSLFQEPGMIILIISGFVGLLVMVRFFVLPKFFKSLESQWDMETAAQKVDREIGELLNIDRAENSWSCDEILLRLQKLKSLAIRSSWYFHKRSSEVHDAVFLLQRIAERRGCIDNTSSDTIIGYERD